MSAGAVSAGAVRYVVYGPYPPMPGDEAAATLAMVRGLVGTADADGGGAAVEVDVVSPVPSAAHHHADADRLSGALRLARRIRSGDRVVLRLSPPIRGGRRAMAGWGAVGLALRRAEESTVHLAALDGPVDPTWARLLLGGAGRVVVTSDADRSAVVAAGVPAGRVEVAPPAPAPVADTAPAMAADPARRDAGGIEVELGPWQLGADPTREELQAEIQRRAAILRRGGALRTAAPSGSAAPPSALELSRTVRSIAPLGPALPRSAKPGVGAVKRVVAKLVGWQVNPVIEQVNRLQAAVVDAFEALEAARDRDESSRL